jgi:DNA-binding transcriptional ArsR family regulator
MPTMPANDAPRVDRLIHEPARLRIVSVLSGVDVAGFNFLLDVLGLSRGNLSSHMDKLEQAGYVRIDKRFEGRVPVTEYRLTDAGRSALEAYWRQMDAVRGLGRRRGGR